MCGGFVYINICRSHACSAHRGLRMATNPLELELYRIVTNLVDAGNKTLLLPKGSQ